LTAQQQAITQQMADLTAQLEALQSLEADIAAQQAQRSTYQAPYEQYLRNRDQANQCAPLKRELGTTETDLEQLQAQRLDLETRYAEAIATYDPAQAEALETRYATLKTEADQLAGSLPQQHQRLADLDQQLAGLATLAEKRDAAQAELKAKEKIKRFVNFARSAYKDAGPRITEQYVRSISVQADRLFRELLNRPDVALEWTRDYDILVQDGPHQRRFINLSGGEQMCAALAVRLALLKVLADIDIAFFDEPTTNMDKPRRQGLAEAISRIKSFKQLFVISHDDTFESITENVILVEREV
jgi:exonuclease SbcC